MSETAADSDRCRFLTGTAVVIGGIGGGIAAIPFISTFQPSARAKAVGAPVEVDISKVEAGQRIIYKWRGKPVWIVRRTPQQLEALESMPSGALRDPGSDESQQPEFALNSWRSSNPEYLVLVGLCTHLGCSPSFIPSAEAKGMGTDWHGGFFCPCHGSKFDLSGRVYSGVPAPRNMAVPPYRFLTESRILIGEGASTT